MSGRALPWLRPAGTGGFVPRSTGGPLWRAFDWLRRNLFDTRMNALLTLLVLAFLALIVPPLVRWGLVHASFGGVTRAACGPDGACWTFIRVHLPLFFFGRYPAAERWRVIAALLLLAGFAVPVLREHVRRRWLWVLLLFTLMPLLAGILLAGGVFGLTPVDTNQWGGLTLDVLISFVTVAGSLPLGVLLALGRRSRLPVVRVLSIGFIELWRGVPLLTVLFMSAVMVPLFLPEGMSIDRLVRALVALILFNAAYMAEVVRGGLQGVPEGQDEAAHSLGLRWWQVQVFVVLPQALRIVVPAIVNTVVDLFKDTTLVTIIGLSDLLGAVTQALKDPAWLGFATEGYVFSAIVFFVCCFAMSAYGRSFERRLAPGQ
ncbi:MAG: amino acid ABC transporter permease [Alphaproteobacteria bacterium]|nr:amino acid ABC transporter permease [Alphaproteobacteria bacterium]